MVKIAAENAIGPLLDLLRAFVVRERKAKITIKLADNTAFEFDSSNIDVDLDRLSKAMLRLVAKSQK